MVVLGGVASVRSADDAGPAPVLPRVVAAIEPHIAASEIAGAVTLVADADGIVHLSASGRSDLAGGVPLREDALFWIASMTKPITGTAVMMLEEEGLLSMEDPVAKHLPEFGELKGPEGAAADVTIAQLLTHSAGLEELTSDEARRITTLAELTELTASKPLKFTPGTKWVYSQTGINTAARIVEVLSGESFPDFLAARLFEPLGMTDTTFYLAEDQLPRLARTYRRTEGGDLEAAELGFLHGKSPTSRDRYPMANGGLFSTARDYARFCRMILREGELDGKRYLKPESVRRMTAVQSGDLSTGFTPGNGWGFGWCVVREPQGVTAALSPGSFGHGGAYGTQAWIDPTKGLVQILMVQRANLPNADASEVRRALHDAVRAGDG